MPESLLRTEGLCKRYGSFSALNNVSLSLERGDIYGLVGRNGAGKTTFFKCVMGLARPTKGTIEIGAVGQA
ncbi:MAG: ATP-binding cassette domain-containing protein, partial [Coriobacteriales bacterium]|nr:ATP-binding cassette domain-containing protein [Coriobacteriales bacterium]